MDSELMELLHRLVEAERRAQAATAGTEEHDAATADADEFRRAIFALWPVEADATP